MNKLGFAFALCVSLICSPAHAKTFVGVLWPMFGPLPAIGLVELVAELKMMPDVEVRTYLHQSWPSLVRDIDRQPAGTHTVVIGYSLGANSSVFVANKAKYVDLIVALQPSMLSWNPPVRGRVGRMIEIYNPNPWMTFGGLGSKRLVGGNIEYIANNDSHPGAQFNSEFRSLVKRQIAKFVAEDRREIAQDEMPRTIKVSDAAGSPEFRPADRPPTRLEDMAAEAPLQTAQADPPGSSEPAVLARAAAEPIEQHTDSAAFLDRLSSSVNSGDLFAQPRLTMADLRNYAERTYHHRLPAAAVATASE